MPIPKYKCTSCGKEFAKIVMRFQDIPRNCPVCGADGPVEMGPAFRYDKSSAERLNCVACDACGDEACATFSASS